MNKFSSKDKELGLALWFKLSRAYHSQLRISTRFLKKWNLSIAQYYVLEQIGANHRLSQKELAEKLYVSKGNITQLIRKMEDTGIINRQKEWKTKYLTLTEKGQQLFDEVVPQQEAFQATQFQKLSRQEQETLLELFGKINQEVIEKGTC